MQNNGVIVERKKTVGRSSQIVTDDSESKYLPLALYANVKECDIKY